MTTFQTSVPLLGLTNRCKRREITEEWDLPGIKRPKHSLGLPAINLHDPRKYSRAASPAPSMLSENSGEVVTKKNFLTSLFTFLRENPTSAHLRWSTDGTYLVIPNKETLLENVICNLFNQKSYSSFARQLNIYGWKRIQTPSDSGDASSTFWKHDSITRDSTYEDLGNVKRNATDKPRRTLSNDDNSGLSGIKLTRKSRQASVDEDYLPEGVPKRTSAPKQPGSALYTAGYTTSNRSPRVPHIQNTSPDDSETDDVCTLQDNVAISAPEDTKLPTDISALPMLHPIKAAHRGVRSERPNPAASGVETLANDSAMESDCEADLGRQHTVPEGTALTSTYSMATAQNPPFAMLANLTVARPHHPPHNPVDVFVMSAAPESTGQPLTFIARDRCDVVAWVDDFAQSRFILAGDLMRSWALWSLFMIDSTLLVTDMNSDSPPRPLGHPQQLRNNISNADPSLASSRERIYLSAPSEAGCIGQCWIVLSSGSIPATITAKTTVTGEKKASPRKLRDSFSALPPFSPKPQSKRPISNLRGSKGEAKAEKGCSTPRTAYGFFERKGPGPLTASVAGSLAEMQASAQRDLAQPHVTASHIAEHDQSDLKAVTAKPPEITESKAKEELL